MVASLAALSASTGGVGAAVAGVSATGAVSLAAAAASAAFFAACAAAALASFSAFSAFSRSSRNCLNSKRVFAWSAAFFSRSRAQISLLAKRKYWTSGMRDGQTKEQQPHSMQSKMLYSCVLPKFLARENQYISNGCSSCGQTWAQAPQRMQGISGALGGNSRSEWAIRQLVALTTGTWRSGTRKPIIGR